MGGLPNTLFPKPEPFPPLGFYPAAACGIDHFRYIDGMTALAKTFMDRLVVLMDPHLTEMDRIFNSHRFLQHP
jgi:hypothetical protein